MSASVTTAVQSKVNALQGEAHFFEDSLSPIKVKEYLARPRDVDKLKGMKWLLAMVSKGKDMSDFFSDVVKNVVVRSVEVKKMVYIFLVHYADASPTCRELALLSINSFQKDLAASNQLIRALALRVMTSIRVSDIIQIQLLAVRKCASDSSPYVRKCAASAIPKIYALDEEQGPELHRIIDKLLRDGSTMVLGSAVAAFSEVCPNNYTLIHPVYRKLCHLLADIDEWGQVILLSVLARYIRNQFTDPCAPTRKSLEIKEKEPSVARTPKPRRRVLKKAFYSDEEDESMEEEDIETPRIAPSVDNFRNPHGINGKESALVACELDIAASNLDEDHRLVLKVSLPLLKSRNTGVVLAVCALYFYCGVRSDAVDSQLSKALVRILRSQRELQFAVLTGIQTMAAHRPYMFLPYLREFFVKAADPFFCSYIKLNILCSIACAAESNAVDGTNTPLWLLVLGEMQSYTRHKNKAFVCQSIKAAARVALAHRDAYEPCLNGLMTIALCSGAPAVVGAATNSIRLLLQQKSDDGLNDMAIISSTVKCLIKEVVLELEDGSKGGIQSDVAQSCVIWMAGEHAQLIADIGPDLLRILANNFKKLSVEVKLQVLGLAVKLALIQPENESVQSLTGYVLQLARFDMNADLQDKSRLLTALMGLTTSNSNANSAALVRLRNEAAGIVLKPKQMSKMTGPSGSNLLIGSLSSAVGYRIWGYKDLPQWSTVRADPSTRNPVSADKRKSEDKNTDTAYEVDSEKFYDSDYNSRSASESESETESGSGSNSSVAEDEEDEDEESASEEESIDENSEDKEEEDEQSESSSQSDYVSSNSSSSRSIGSGIEVGEGIGLLNLTDSAAAASSYGVLLAPESIPAVQPLDIQSTAVALQNAIGSHVDSLGKMPPLVAPVVQDIGKSQPLFVEKSRSELVSGKLNSSEMVVRAAYCRALPTPEATTLLTLIFSIENHTDSNMRHIRAVPPRDGTAFEGWGEVKLIPPGEKADVRAKVDFKGRSRAVRFEIKTDKGSSMVSITPPTGELICPLLSTPQKFESDKRGTTACSEEILTDTSDANEVGRRLLRSVNIGHIQFESESKLLFSGAGFVAGKPDQVLVELDMKGKSIKVSVYSANATIPPLLLPVITSSILDNGT